MAPALLQPFRSLRVYLSQFLMGRMPFWPPSPVGQRVRTVVPTNAWCQSWDC